MKKLFLHIGMGKTGTTALQEFFWENRATLERNDICYPVFGAVAGAHHMLSPNVPPFLKDVWDFKTVAEWAPKLMKAGQSRILLSSELMAWAEEDIAIDFCRAVKELFETKVVIYLRRQDSIIMATFNQQIKAGHQKRELKQILEHQISRFDYQKILSPWVSIFGRDNIIVRPYERQQFYRGDIRWDFLHQVFGLEKSDSLRLSNDNSNPRLSLAAMAYKLKLNNLDDDVAETSPFNDVLIGYSTENDTSSQSVFASQSVLSPAQRVDILQRSEAINTQIAEDLMGRADGQLFYDPEPDITEAWDEYKLSRGQAMEITRYIEAHSPKLLRRLARLVSCASGSDLPRQRHAAAFLAPCVDIRP